MTCFSTYPISDLLSHEIGENLTLCAKSEFINHTHNQNLIKGGACI